VYADETRVTRSTVDDALLSRERVAFETIALSEVELKMAVQLSTSMNDGEAQTLAIAAARGLPLLSDDLAVERAAQELAVPLETSLNILEAWSRQHSVSPEEVRAAAFAMRVRANYEAPETHCLRGWFLDLMSGPRPEG